MRYFIPRVSPQHLFLALAVAAPAVLLGALANALVTIELARLDLLPRPGASGGDVDALLAFKAQAEVLIVGVFLALALATLAVLLATPDAVAPINVYAAALVVLLALIVAGEWTLGFSRAAARIGVGTALWGLSWVLAALHLFAFLRAVPHRRWLWVTGALAAFYFLAALLVFVLAWLTTVEVAAVLVALGAAAAAALVHARRVGIARLWGYANQRAVRLPAVARGIVPLVALYLVLVLGLMGAAYQHQFDYRPIQSLEHYLLMGFASLTGVLLFGALAWRGGRRSLLWAIPGATGAAVLLQVAFLVRWPAALAVGLMLGAVFYLFQYAAETTQRMTRSAAFLYSMSAVVVLGAGASIVAQLPAIDALTPERILVLQVAALVLAFLVTPQLPETRSSGVKEEAMEEYLEMARRVQEERG